MMNQTLDDQIVLSYHDCLLRHADVMLLNGPYWLNDAIIGFYFEYLEQSIVAEYGGQIKFASPELTQLLKMLEPNDYSAILNSTITDKTDYVFFPFNDCDKVDEAGGSHWSLLVYSKSERTCFHFDSFGGSNEVQARAFSRKIMEHLLHSEPRNFKEISSPQQNNSYDCGIFVLCNAKTLLDNLRFHSKIEGSDLTQVKFSAKNKRSELQQIIGKLNEDN